MRVQVVVHPCWCLVMSMLFLKIYSQNLYLTVFLICFSLMANNVENIFMGLFNMHTLILVKYILPI